MNIKVKRMSEEAKLPTRGSEKAAAYDVYACLPKCAGYNHASPNNAYRYRA